MLEFIGKSIHSRWGATGPPVTFVRNVVWRNGKGRNTVRILRSNTVSPSRARRSRKVARAQRNPQKYRIGIPSFQGDWGFWLWSSDGPAFNIPDSVTQEWMIRMPLGLKVVDEEQIREWIRSTRLWRQAVRDA